MRIFVALAFACGALAAAVQPLEPASEARDVLTSDFDMKGAYLDMDTDSEVAGLEARSEELEDAEGLNKRAYLFRRVVKIPEISHGAKPPTPMPVELYGVRFMFLMEERQTVLGSELQSEWYCSAIRVSNLVSTRRLAIMRTSRRSIFRRVMPYRSSQIVQLPEGLRYLELGAAAAPK
ncbi:hypothetical protein E4U09_000639 [Claviceps aff. purpurea]|uniref:Uncharacterized protein n=1 Tax=Claviceps aff. purpurea TaxID=1967640 RepID=A0A9P7QIL4_9HYPO|nr:hypothetical protein E4U34_000304 [Claviceps purpurea]KAG6298649.1 hypothetical protein E4U09_000639 [Claviceps aff. purpurea]